MIIASVEPASESLSTISCQLSDLPEAAEGKSSPKLIHPLPTHSTLLLLGAVAVYNCTLEEAQPLHVHTHSTHICSVNTKKRTANNHED